MDAFADTLRQAAALQLDYLAALQTARRRGKAPARGQTVAELTAELRQIERDAALCETAAEAVALDTRYQAALALLKARLPAGWDCIHCGEPTGACWPPADQAVCPACDAARHEARAGGAPF